MSKIFPFEDDSFDIIFNPVSVCYIDDVEHVWKESFRVLKHGGIFMSGFGNPFQMALDENNKVMHTFAHKSKKNTQEKGLNVRRRWLLFQSFFGYADRGTGTGRVLPYGFV